MAQMVSGLCACFFEMVGESGEQSPNLPDVREDEKKAGS